MDSVVITPEKGKAKEIGQKLLELADNPRDVQWVTWPAAGFSVPMELFARFDADGDEPEAEEEAAPKRRRRRSKEATESTDNNTSEEE